MQRYENWDKIIKKLEELGSVLAKYKEREELKLEEDKELETL